MSLVKSKAIQLGFDATPTNNFLIYQPLTPDGTFRIANGNQGATTDIMTVTSGGSVTFSGTTNFSSLNFGAGSESAPSLFPTGDSNTGVWFPAADTFAVSTGGAERIRIMADGKIGLGASNPAFKLDVREGSIVAGTGGMVLYGRNSAAVPSASYATGLFALGTHHLDNLNGGLSIYTRTADSLTEKVRIDKDGYVGIGNASPVYALDIATPNSGNIAWQRTGVAAKKWGISSDNYGTYFGNVTDTVWNILTLSNAGNVGIGVGSSSIAKLTVASSDDLDGGKALSVYGAYAPTFGNSTSNVAGPVNFAYLASSGKKSVVSVMSRNSGVAGNNYTSYTGEIAELRLCGTGTDQNTAIQAASIIAITSDSTFGNSNTTKADLIFTTRGGGAVDRISSPERMRITGDGRVGIGTNNPAYTLDVTGTVRAGTAVSQGQASTSNLATNAHTLLGGNGGNYLAIGQCDATYSQTQWIQSAYQTPSTAVYNIALQPLGGNVGIGTYSPQARLHVGSGWVGIHSDINTSTAVPAWASARITGEIHAGSGVSSGSDGGLLRLSAGGETNSNQKAGIDMSGYNTTDGGPTLRFYTGAERMRITGDGRVMINSLTSSNAIFECTTKGSDGNWGFRVMNPLSQMVFALMGDGTFYTGQAANSPYNKATGAAANVYISSDVGMMYRSTSSLRYKTNIKDMEYGLAEALTLRPVTFQNINDEKETSYGGLIAEEVEEAGLVEFVDYDDDGRPDALHYGNMVSLCIKAIQDLAQQNAELKARLDAAGL